MLASLFRLLWEVSKEQTRIRPSDNERGAAREGK